VVKEELPEWEQRLWDLVCAGDGSNCPLYARCVFRERGLWCFAEHISEVARLLDFELGFGFRKFNFAGTGKQRPGTPLYLTEKLANKLLKLRGVCSPPVPDKIVELCDEKCPVEVRQVPLSAYHGAIWSFRDRWVIHLNSNDEPGMKRHTLFHEAFHIIAHANGIPAFKKTQSQKYNFNEALADYFAMSLLMPRAWVIEKWAECRDVLRMAEIFQVLPSCMDLRLRWLHLI